MKLFSYESVFSQILLKLAWSCYLNLLWFLCSLPLFTIGASTTALYTVTLKIANEKEGNLTAQFFRAFRENFRQATLLWLILLFAGGLLAGDGYILFHLFRTAGGPAAVLWTLVSALVIAASIAYVIVLLYVFPLTASVVNTTPAMLKNSFFIGTHYLFCTLLMAAVRFAMFYIIVAVYTPAAIFGEGLCALISSYWLSGIIRACSSGPSGEQTDGQSAEQPDGQSGEQPDGQSDGQNEDSETEENG